MNTTYPLYNIPPFKCVIYDVVINLLLISIIPRHPDDHQSLRSRKPQIPTSIDHYHIKQRHVYTCHCNPSKITPSRLEGCTMTLNTSSDYKIFEFNKNLNLTRFLSAHYSELAT